MRAWMNTSFGGFDRLRLGELPTPTPGGGEFRVQVLCAGVNHVDWQLREGFFRGAQTYRFPFVPGWDVAGIIDAVGPDTEASGLGVGDVIFAYCRTDDLSRDGSYAEYVTLDAKSCAPVPPELEPHEAAVLPVSALTALQLVEAADPQPGERVWLAGAGGGVGRLVLALLVARGCEITALARPERTNELRELGARAVVEPAALDLESTAGAADMVLDCGLSLDVADVQGLLVPKGRLLTITNAPDQEAAQDEGITARHLFSRPDGERLGEVARLLRDGAWVPPTVSVAAMTAAPDLQRRMRDGSRERLCLRIAY
ncbi:NADP-dependent oxidoreductase [Micromonospora aurantiaca]|uniref:NADP-dependent oxidoreductase n=1 Tax=Micromonospora aurantiaca (nom. illeg.) TaxID=47850 RepID=UPI0034526BA0